MYKFSIVVITWLVLYPKVFTDMYWILWNRNKNTNTNTAPWGHKCMNWLQNHDQATGCILSGKWIYFFSHFPVGIILASILEFHKGGNFLTINTAIFTTYIYHIVKKETCCDHAADHLQVSNILRCICKIVKSDLATLCLLVAWNNLDGLLWSLIYVYFFKKNVSRKFMFH